MKLSEEEKRRAAWKCEDSGGHAAGWRGREEEYEKAISHDKLSSLLHVCHLEKAA